jgi:hypothetical protein
MNAGERHESPIEVVQYSEDAVAEYVAGWLVAHKALPSYYIEYQCFPWCFLFLRRGDNVLLTDDRWGWSQDKATVENIRYARGNCAIGLRVWSPYYKLGGASAGQPVG